MLTYTIYPYNAKLRESQRSYYARHPLENCTEHRLLNNCLGLPPVGTYQSSLHYLSTFILIAYRLRQSIVFPAVSLWSLNFLIINVTHVTIVHTIAYEVMTNLFASSNNDSLCGLAFNRVRDLIFAKLIIKQITLWSKRKETSPFLGRRRFEVVLYCIGSVRYTYCCFVLELGES